jgi:hypothetical protein
MNNTPDVRLNTDGFPYGTVSLNMRRTKWWAIYTDAEGNRIQMSTLTDDRNAARLIAAQKAIEVLKAKLEILQGIVHEAKANKGHAEAGRGTERRPAGGRAEATRGDRKATKKGGKR